MFKAKCCNRKTFTENKFDLELYKCVFYLYAQNKRIMESTSDLSLEQIKERMKLYQRLQERKRRNRPYFYGKKP